jgi:hypothetical protein
VSQQADFSDGSQQLCSTSGAQQLELVATWISSAMRRAP